MRMEQASTKRFFKILFFLSLIVYIYLWVGPNFKFALICLIDICNPQKLELNKYIILEKINKWSFCVSGSSGDFC